jgi:hypothetical protein
MIIACAAHSGCDRGRSGRGRVCVSMRGRGFGLTKPCVHCVQAFSHCGLYAQRVLQSKISEATA